MARKTRYIIADRTHAIAINVGGCLAASYEEAQELALVFGPKCRADEAKYIRGSGWSDSGGLFYVKSSRYGQKYKCMLCGKERLGSGMHMHWSECPKYEAPPPPPPPPMSGREAARIFLDLADKGGQDMSSNEWALESARLRGRADVFAAMEDDRLPSTLITAFPELQRQ